MASKISKNYVQFETLLASYYLDTLIIGKYNGLFCFLIFFILIFLQRTKVNFFIIPIDKQSKGAKVTNLGCLSKAMKIIKQKFGKDGVKLFRKTCFCHFLRIKPIIFFSAIVHNLLVQQVECDGPKVIEFNFRRIGVRFDCMTFAIVTRLSVVSFH